jgi:hypothetical protein
MNSPLEDRKVRLRGLHPLNGGASGGPPADAESRFRNLPADAFQANLEHRSPPRTVAVSIEESSAPPSADTHSIEAIIARLYALISGPAGQPRDWDAFRAMFIDGARMIPTNRAIHDGRGGHPPEVMDVETFIRTTTPVLEAMGFEERQVAMRVERFGCVAHAWSTYESRRAPDDAEPFARGINSIQLYHDGARWWVVTVFWDSERSDNPVPPEYLP